MSKENLILPRLEKVRNCGNGKYLACCPAHDDRDPSLAVRVTNGGKILLHCFAGCSALDIVNSIGMTLGDLFPEGRDVHWLGGFDRYKQKKREEAVERDRLVLAMADEDRRNGKRLSQADLKRERQAYMAVHHGK